MASSALAALGNYVDSDEEQHDHEEEGGSVAEIVPAKIPLEIVNPPTPQKPSTPPNVVLPTREPSPDNYEVYPMERDDTDEEEVEAEEEEEKEVTDVEMAEKEPSPEAEELPPVKDPNDPALIKRLISDGNIDFPPEPTGECPRHLQDKISWLIQEMNANKKDMNQVIQAKKSFRNPSIYEKLIQFCNIDEFGTNYPPEVYNPLKWDKSSYYDELAKVQKAMIDKKLKAKQDKLQGVVFDKQYKKPLPAPGVVAPTNTASSAAIPRRTTVF